MKRLPLSKTFLINLFKVDRTLKIKYQKLLEKIPYLLVVFEKENLKYRVDIKKVALYLNRIKTVFNGLICEYLK